MKLTLSKTSDPFGLLANNDQGNTINFDGSEAIGGKGTGFRPMQALAASLAACSSIDVLLILKKQHFDITEYDVDIEAVRTDEVPAIFESIHLRFKLKGAPLDKCQRAVSLSIDKYCSVSRMLEHKVKITYSVDLIE